MSRNKIRMHAHRLLAGRKLPVVGLLAGVLTLAAALPVALASAAPVTGTLVENGVSYTYAVENGEASVTAIAKAQGNVNATYEARVPESIVIDGKNYLVTSIGANAMGTKYYNGSYTENTELEKLVLPSKLLRIGEQSFLGCTALTSVEFAVDDEGASHVEDIASMAFLGCGSVREWLLPDSLTYVGAQAFSMSGAVKVRLPGAQTTWEEPSSVLGTLQNCTDLVIPEGCVTLPRLTVDKAESITIPSTVTGSVDIYSTSGGLNNKLSSITFPENVKFSTLRLAPGEIADLIIPEGVKTVDIMGGAYETILFPSTLEDIERLSATPLRELVIPASVKSISGSYAFSRSDSLEKVTFAEGSQLERVGEYAFSRCSNLREVVLGEGVKALGGRMFDGCSSLTSVVVPASVKLANAAFTNCEALERIEFARGSEVESLWQLASGCPALKEVLLPDGLKSVQHAGSSDFLFRECPALADVYVYTPDLELRQTDFSNCGTPVIHGWGQGGALVAFAEGAGYAFEPLAELDGSAFTGAANVTVQAQANGTVRAVCSFATPTSYDYERELVAGVDYTLERVQRGGLDYYVLRGNGLTCFGETEAPALIDLGAHGQVASIPAQFFGGSPCAPAVRVTCNDIVLHEGVDYTVSYEDNDALGTGTAVVRGCGNYSGELRARFAIAGAAYAGADRVGNSVAAVSGAEGATNVVVAGAWDFSSLAAAAAYAGASEQPLLAVSSEGLTTSQKALLEGWDTARALMAGRADVLGERTMADVAAACPGAVTHVIGADAAAQALALARAADAGMWGNTAVVASPNDAALCMAAAAYAASVRAPLLYTQEDGTVDAETAAYARSFSQVVVVGNYFYVDASADETLGGVQRIAGDGAPQTALALAEHGFSAGAYGTAGARLLVVTEADATSYMAWAAVAGSWKAPVLLVGSSSESAVLAFAKAHASAIEGYAALERVPGTLANLTAALQGILD